MQRAVVAFASGILSDQVVEHMEDSARRAAETELLGTPPIEERAHG